MSEKLALERRLDEQRKLKRQKQELEIREIEESRK